SFAQVGDSSIAEVSHIHYSDTLADKCFFYAAPKDSVTNADIPFLPYKPRKNGRSSVPGKVIEKECFMRFTVHNDADTLREFYFVPGYYLQNIEMFEASYADPAKLTQL